MCLTSDHLLGPHLAHQRPVHQQSVDVARLEVDPEGGQGARVEQQQQQVQVVPALVTQPLLVQQLLSMGQERLAVWYSGGLMRCCIV